MGILAWCLIMFVVSVHSQRIAKLYSHSLPITSTLGRAGTTLCKKGGGLVSRIPIIQKPQHRSVWSAWRGGGQIDPGAREDISLERSAPEPVLGRYPVSISSIRGLRSYMEDDFCVSDDLVGVFDGHGGAAVSKYLRLNLHAEVQAALPRAIEKRRRQLLGMHGQVIDDIDPETPSLDNYRDALLLALEAVNKKVCNIKHWSFQGSTAIAVWLHESIVDPPILPPIEGQANTEDESDDDTIEKLASTISVIAANIGDSRIVLSRNRMAVPLSRDHKPNDPIELDRIHALGGEVIWHGEVDSFNRPILKTGVYRVNGNLALSRAIGDASEAPVVTADPEVVVMPLEESDEFIILATDGLWDVLSSADVVAMVHALLRQPDVYDRDIVANLLVEEALRRGSFDNITVVIVWLKDHVPVESDDNDLGIMEF